MGAEQSNLKLDLIEQQATSIILSYRQADGTLDKNACIDRLKSLSNDAARLKNAKRKKVDAVIACVEDYMREINGERRDSKSVESHSFVALPTNRRMSRNSIASVSSIPPELERKKDYSEPSLNAQPSSIQDINGRLQSLKNEIKTAINNNDSKTLRTIERTIQVLTHDLQRIKQDPSIQEALDNIQKQLTTCYNKVTKAQKDMKKLVQQDYERKASVKNFNKKEFEMLEAAVEDQNVLLETALKTDNSLLVKHVFDKLEEFKSSLIPLTDSLRKQRLQIKLDEMNKKTNERIERYTVASRLSEHERDFNTIKTKKDGEDVKRLMDNLKKHIEDIPENSEDTLKRKQNLLKQVNEYISGINKETEPETVVLRNKINELDSVKSLNEFFIQWNNIKEILHNAKTTEEAKNIYFTLNKLETSVREFKLVFQNKFNFRKSQVSFKDDGSSYLSVRSCTNSELVRTKAKIYNIPINEVKEISNTAVKTQAEKNVEALNEIRNIQSKVNFLKDKLKTNSKNENYKLKMKLYYDKLTDFTAWDNENVSLKARILRDQIQEVTTTLNRRSNTRKKSETGPRISVQGALDKVVAIQTTVNSIEEEILRDLDNSKALAVHREKLIIGKEKLQSIEVPKKCDMVKQSRDLVMEKINYCLNIVDSKLNHGFKSDNSIETSIQIDLNKLKEQVNRFSGGYKNVLYNTIETKLNKLLLQVTESISDETLCSEYVAEIEKSLKILEQRSTKSQSFRQNIRTSTVNKKDQDLEMEEKVNKINESLAEVKKDIRIDDPLSLSGRLNLLKIEVDQLHLRASEAMKTKVQDLLDDIEGCHNFVSNRMNAEYSEMDRFDDALDKTLINPTQNGKLNKVEIKLNEIENKLNLLKPSIDNFVGIEDCDEYDDLQDNLVNLTLELNLLDKCARKIQLMYELNKYEDLLEVRSKQCKDLFAIENDIENIKSRKPNLGNKDEVEDLDEELTTLQIRLMKMTLDKILDERKSICFNFVKNYLSEIRKINDLDRDGTLV